jgi:hypothetical protein
VAGRQHDDVTGPTMGECTITALTGETEHTGEDLPSPRMEAMNVTSTIDRQIPWSPGAVRAQRTGLVTMGVFTGAWS